MAFVQFAADVAFVASPQKLGNQVIRRFQFEQHFAGLRIKYHKAFVFHVFQTAFQLAERDVFQHFWAANAILFADFIQFRFRKLTAGRHVNAAD